MGAVLAPLEPPEAGPLLAPVSPAFVGDGLFGSFRNWVGPVGAVPMLAAVAAAIALSAWNEACSIACMASGFADSEIIPAGDTENMLLTWLTVTWLPVIRLVRRNDPACCSPVWGLVSNPSDATVWPSTDDTSTVTNVPRMPNVAVGFQPACCRS